MYRPVGPIVPPSGDLECKIAFIGARPGKDEVGHEPFVGASGRLLWHLNRGRYFDGRQIYTTNVRRDFSESHSVPTPTELRDALPTLREELAASRANLLVALGGEALLALTNLHSIESWRGSVVPSTLLPNRKVLATWHPAACLYEYNLRYVLDLDLRRARREADFPQIIRPQRDFYINPEFDDAVSLLRSLGQRVAVDIETLEDIPACVGISDSPHRAVLIPFIGSRYSLSELAYLWREMDVVFRTRESIGQNFQFDVSRLERLGFYFGRIVHDTMLSHHLLWTELGSQFRRKGRSSGVDALTGKHSLAFISSIYTHEPYYKHESDAAWGEPGLELGDRFYRWWTYCCKDACVTYESAIALDRELTQYGQKEFYDREVISLIRPLIHLQSRGLRVDLAALADLRTRLDLETRYLQLSLESELGIEINVRSPTDIRYLINDVLGMRSSKKTKRGSTSTDKDVLLKLSETSVHAPIFSKILEIRKRRTLVESFLKIPLVEGRYKANYLLHGTDTGRLSSRATGQGPQLQNIPSAARRVFIPAEGHVFIEGDYKRAEAMYVAYDSQCARLIELFEDETRDLYREVATDCLTKAQGEVTGSERQTFKQVVLGSNYGLGPDKLVATLRVHYIDIMDLDVPGRSPRAKAEYVQKIYLGRYPEVRAWQRMIQQTVIKTRALTNALGRRKTFLDRLDSDSKLLRSALAYPAQSTVGVLTNSALRVLSNANEPIVGQLHDALLGEPTIEDAPRFARALVTAMTRTIDMHGRPMTIPVEVKYGYNWGEMRPFTEFHSPLHGVYSAAGVA